MILPCYKKKLELPLLLKSNENFSLELYIVICFTNGNNIIMSSNTSIMCNTINNRNK